MEEADQEMLALRDPLVHAVKAQEMVRSRLAAGDIQGARAAYQDFAAAFGQVLGPVSLENPQLAQQMANASTEMQELFEAQEPDQRAIAGRSALILSTLQQAAGEMGLPPVAAAGGELGAFEAEAAGSAEPDAEEAARSRETKAVTVEVKATEYRFMPPRIEVEKGTRVTIRFQNVGSEKHEFELEGLRKEIRPIPPGAVAELTFTADKAGVFEYACHVNGHYEKGMRGELVVK